MGMDAATPERREYRRIAVRHSAIAVIQSTPAILLGQIRDISMKGLSFSYMHSDRQPYESEKLDIFLPEERLHIKGLKFSTVSDLVILNDNPFSTVVMNQRGIRFEALNDQQRSQLEHILCILSDSDLGSGCPLFDIKKLANMSV